MEVKVKTLQNDEFAEKTLKGAHEIGRERIKRI